MADGYGNRRVIVFDADTGRVQAHVGRVRQRADRRARHAGAAAARRRRQRRRPRAAPAPLDTEGQGSQQFGGPVHGVKVSNDGLVYVADRRTGACRCSRSTASTSAQVFINRAGPSNGSVAGIAFSPDDAQRFLYLADYGNSHVAGAGSQERCRCSISSARAARSRPLPGPAPPRRRLEGQSLRGGSRCPAIARSGSRSRARPRTLPAERADARRSSRPAAVAAGAGAGRRRAGARVPAAGTGARRLSAVDEHDGQSVPDHAQLAAARRHQARRGHRHHPGRQGRDVAAPPLGAANPAHRRVGRRRSPASATACSCRHTASARTATATSGPATADRSRTIRPPRAAASRCSSSAPTARCC